MNNGAKVKIVTQRSNNIGSLPKNLQKLMTHPNFEIRYVSYLPSSIVAIFDQDQVNILLATDKSPTETPLLMTNNSVLIGLARNYFEIMWTNALGDTNQQYPKKSIISGMRTFRRSRHSQRIIAVPLPTAVCSILYRLEHLVFY